jgi:regulator of replication initiation timing
MTTTEITPDAEQVEATAARRLLELAGVYTRQALQFPDDVKHVRTICAELLLENAMLRLDVADLRERIEALERRRP